MNLWISIVHQSVVINFSIDLHTDNTQFALPAVLVQLDFNIQNDVYYVYFNGLLQKKKKNSASQGWYFCLFFCENNVWYTSTKWRGKNHLGKPCQTLARGQFQTFYDCKFVAENQRNRRQNIQKHNKLTYLKFHQECLYSRGNKKTKLAFPLKLF